MKKNHELYIKALLLRASTFVHLGTYDLALKDVDRSKITSEKLGWDLQYADSIIMFSNIHNLLGKYDEMYEAADHVVELCRKINYKEGLWQGLHNIGYYKMIRGDFDEALNIFESSLKIAKKISNPHAESIISNNLGYICKMKGDLKKGLAIYKKALNININIGNHSGAANVMSNIGAIYYQKGKYMRSIEFFKQALDIREKIQDYHGTAICLNNIGSVYNSLCDLEMAEKYFIRSAKMKEKLQDKLGLINSYNSISRLYRLKGKLNRSQYFLNKAYKLGETIKENVSFSNTLVYFAMLYENKNEIKKSNEYYLKAENLISNKQNANLLFLVYSGFLRNAINSEDLSFIIEYKNKAEEFSQKAGSMLAKNSILILNAELALMIIDKGSASLCLNIDIPAILIQLEKFQKDKEMRSLHGEIHLLNARYFAITGDYDHAYEGFQKAVTEFKNISYRYDEMRTYYHFLKFLIKTNDFKKAKLIHRKLEYLTNTTEIKKFDPHQLNVKRTLQNF